jgi:RsiW-degrading membrane proteinase PrsW (M82 family)
MVPSFVATLSSITLVGGMLIATSRTDPARLKAAFFLFIAGALGSTALALSGSAALPPPPGGLVGEAVLRAPLVEEASKGVALLVVLRWATFEDRVDGWVYGSTVGLGFALTENLLYLAAEPTGRGTQSGLVLVFVRSLLPALMHAVASGLLGASLARARRHTRPLLGRAWSLSIGLIGAVALHSLWNSIVLS